MAETSAGAWEVPATSLIEEAARLCTAAGLHVCAVYPSAGSQDPIARSTLSADLDERALEFSRHPVYVNGEERAYVVFGWPQGEAPSRLVERARALIGAAISQSERLTHYHHVADRLQRSLLPARFPSIVGMRLDAAYSPGSTEAEVGGDWYDAFEVAEDTICISIGDVTGHGLESAVTMSELRGAIRAAAFAHTSAQAALDSVDALAASQNIGLATAIVGYLHTKSGELRYACAGHPGPLLLAPTGRAFLLPGGGTLLGLGAGCASPERTATLPPGAAFVLYTDGLIEYDRDLIAGETRLISCVESLAGDGPIEGRALHDLVVQGRPRDDCASLIVTRLPVSGPRRERYAFSALPSSARLLREAIRSFTARCGIGAEEEFAVLLACGEAIANGIEHGSQEAGAAIALEIAFDGGALTVDIESRGHWRTSSSENRGRGIAIMRAYSKQFQLSSSSENTRVSLSF